MTGSRRRALIAALVGTLGATVGIAGAGHAYLRRWRRAAAWFSFVLGVGLVLLSTFADPRSVTPATVPPEVTLPVLGLLLVSVADAFRLALRSARRTDAASGDPGEDGPSCPHCGRSLDPSLAFCWYCAEPVRDDAPDEGTA
ncbi:MAG: zinc ribbon domain-containing protein [Haloferacaceae archaeon]